MMTSLMLPYPPSVNGLFAGKAHRYKSKRYKAWLKEAQDDLDFQKYYDGLKWKNHKGLVRISLLAKAPDKRNRDIDNIIKPVLDFLVTHGVIAGDDNRYVQSVMAKWHESMDRSGCFVVVESVQ